MNQPDACQVCKEAFKPGDDIVICPHCGAPYHRECYQKEGHCVYASKHAQGFEYAPASPVGKGPQPAAEGAPTGEAYQPGGFTANTVPPLGGQAPTGSAGMVCQNCRTINDKNHIFCERCGYPLHSKAPAAGAWQPPSGNAAGPSAAPPFMGGAGGRPSFMGGAFSQAYAPPDLQGEFDGLPKQDWASFIGPSTPDYFMRMNQQDRRGSKFSLTLSAFFFSHLYFAYRKMWGWAAVAVLIHLVLSAPSYLAIFMQAGLSIIPGLTAENLLIAQDVSLYLQIIRNVGFGAFALFLYRKDAAKKIRSLRQGGLVGPEYQMALAKKGGVSVLGVVGVVAFFFLIVTLLVVYGGQPFMNYILSEANPFSLFLNG